MEFVGECALNDILFTDGASFEGCVISGRMSLSDMRARGTRELTFAAARIAPEGELEVATNTKDPGDANTWVNFRKMTVHGKLTVINVDSFYRQMPLDLDHMKLERGCVEVIHGLSLTKDSRPRYLNQIMARDWEVSSGSQILIPQNFIDNDTVELGGGFNQSVLPDNVKTTFKVPPTPEF